MSEHELLPLYVLGSLPDDERVAFEAHLGACAECRSELASYEPALAHLVAGVEQQPPASMRSEILLRIHETPQEQPFTPPAPQPVPVHERQTRSQPRWLALAAGILLFALVAVSATGLVLWNRLGVLEQEVARSQTADELANVLAADDAELLSFDTELSGNLRVAVAPSLGTGVVLGDDLQAPPDDRTYQLWLLEDGQPRSAGLIAQTDGVLGELSQVSDAQTVAISIEPPSGSDAPTGPIVAQADLSG